MESSAELIKWVLENLNYWVVTIFMTIESSFIPFPSEVIVPPAAWKAMTDDSMNIFLVVIFATIGADLGAEKFFDIKCRKAGIHPDAVVLVATVRALKYNGGVPKDQLSEENLEALKKGIVNLEKHIENIQKYHVPVVVTLNSFLTDTEAEYEFIRNFSEERG